MITGDLCAMGQVVWVNADAVSSDKPRSKPEEIPFRGRRGQNIGCVDIEQVEDQRQFVDQRYIQIALGVLDNLRGFRHPDRWCPVNPRGDDGAIDPGYNL